MPVRRPVSRIRWWARVLLLGVFLAIGVPAVCSNYVPVPVPWEFISAWFGEGLQVNVERSVVRVDFVPEQLRQGRITIFYTYLPAEGWGPLHFQRTTAGYWNADLDLAWPLCMLGSLLALLWLPGRRAGQGACPSCGYDLRGLKPGTCPECGKTQDRGRSV